MRNKKLSRIFSRLWRVPALTLLIVGWVFYGWPQIFDFPPGIQRAEASTALTAYLTSTAATTLSTADQLSASAPASETHTTTKIAKTTGYCELFSQGSNQACSGAGSAPAPSGNGFLLDDTSLEAQQILSGNWTGAMKLAVNKSGVTVTALMRAYAYNGTTYTLIAQSQSASKSLSTTAAALTFSAGAGPLTNFAIGDKLYVDVIVDITSNTANSSTETISLYMNGGTAEKMTTPGYQPGPPIVTTQAASSVTQTGATLNGTIAAEGVNSTVRGFAYGTDSTLATVIATTTESGSFGTGAFTYAASGLTCNTTYYARAYATDSAGDGLGSTQSFTTSACTVISITITSSGAISYGALAAGVSSSTVPAYTQTAKNDGTGSEEFDIKGQNTACPWTLAGTSGTDQYVHEFSTNGGSSWTALTTSYQALATGIAASASQSFDLRITVPSSTACFNQQSVDVTIQAVAG